MKKLDIKIIHYKDVITCVGIQANYPHITEYLNGGRQDILENFDIFTENVRSINKKTKNFDLFNIVSDINPDTVIVIGFYLELLEYWGMRHRVYDVVKYYTNEFPNNKILVTWNHDIDATNVFNFINEFPNLYVLNFNTSTNHDRYILLPFWTIDDETLIKEKKYFANLLCSFNNKLRINLRDSLNNVKDILVSDRVGFDIYKSVLSESRFTMCPRGLGLSSYRFFEAIQLNTIPVLFADDIILPYSNRLNYSDFIIRIPESQSNNKEFIINTLNSVDYDSMLDNLNKIKEQFTLKGVQEEIYNRLI